MFHSNTPGESVDYCGRKCEESNNSYIMMSHSSHHAVFVANDCKTLVVEGTNTIAGSCCSMLDIFHNLTSVLSVPLGQAVAMLSETPAR